MLAADDSRQRHVLARVVDEHEIPLRRFLRIRLANESDREEIAQEVFLRLCRQKDLEDKLSAGVESTRAYLFTVATNLIRDMRRRAVVRQSDYHEDFDDQTFLDKTQSIEDQVEVSQDLEIALRIIDRMPRKRSSAFIMNRFQGMSYREIAEKMGVSCSMVEKHISAALLDIRNASNQESRI